MYVCMCVILYVCMYATGQLLTLGTSVRAIEHRAYTKKIRDLEPVVTKKFLVYHLLQDREREVGHEIVFFIQVIFKYYGQNILQKWCTMIYYTAQCPNIP